MPPFALAARVSSQDRGDVRAAEMPPPIPLADTLCDRPECAAPNCPPVHLDDGEDATGGATEEGFVGGVEIVGREVALLAGDTELDRDLEDGLTGDPLQNAAARSVEHTAAHEEDVRAAALGEQAPVVEEHHVVGAGAL